MAAAGPESIGEASLDLADGAVLNGVLARGREMDRVHPHTPVGLLLHAVAVTRLWPGPVGQEGAVAPGR